MKQTDKINKIFRYWLPVVAWAIVIFLFSANPTTRTSEIHWQDFVIKKSAHLFVYSVLTLLVYRAFFNYGFEAKVAAKFTMISNVLYAISDEIHQGFTPGREPTLRDILIDTFAIVLVIFVINNLRKFPELVRSWAKKFEIVR